MRKGVNLKLQENILEQLRAIAQFQGVAMSSIVTMLIKQEYRRLKHEIEQDQNKSK